MKYEKEVFDVLKKEFPELKRNILLKNYTTFKIGGPAEYFLVAREKKKLLDAIKLAKKLNLKVFIMGGGSNLLVSDEGFKGLVIKIEKFTAAPKLSVEARSPKTKNSIVVADAGIELGEVVKFCVDKSLRGIEWAGGLPGSFGGAIRGNAGAFGGEIKDSILYVEALDSNLKLRKISDKQCKFSYRSSIFKEKKWTVISAALKLEKDNKEDLQAVVDSRIQYRKEKHPLEYPNVGSIFKNVDVRKISPKIKNVFSDKIKQDPFPIVPAAWFIIGAGLTGEKVGKAQISKKHSNYIVNLGGAKSEDVLKLIDLAKKKVKIKYGVDLETEIQLVGF